MPEGDLTHIATTGASMIFTACKRVPAMERISLPTIRLSEEPTLTCTPEPAFPAAVSRFFLAGMLIVAVGAATVLTFGPRGHAK